LRQDLRILGLDLPRNLRFHLVASKYSALYQLARRRPAHLRVGEATLGVPDAFGLGLVMFNIANQVEDCHALDLPAAPTVVDVGANIGQFCAATKLLWPRANVLSIEADPDVAERLAQNLGRLAGVTTVSSGVGRREEDLPWYADEVSVLSSFRPRAGGGARVARAVHVRPLDDLTADIAAIDLLKIDVEGFEYEVLKGAELTLKKSRWLWIEAGLLGENAGMELISLIHAMSPTARLTDVGRTYSPHGTTECVDLLIDLSPTGS
jgi:FkbM family methyltransferase